MNSSKVGLIIINPPIIPSIIAEILLILIFSPRKRADKIVTNTGPKKVRDIQSASSIFLRPTNKAIIAIVPHTALHA